LVKQYELNDFEVTNNSILNKLNGSDFIFKGLWNNEQSIKSIEGIDIAWVEEAQTVSERSLEVLTPTVRKDKSQIVYTYNRLLEDDPVHNRLVIQGRPNTLIINVNYDIAIKYGMMPEVIRLEMEDDKEKRPALYLHKWMGEPHNQERKIYRDWAFIDEVPHEARLERYGLDFGYSQDPTAIVAIYYYNGGYILNEITYQKGLSNKTIADILTNKPHALVIADSAEPKSIDEIMSYGVNIQPCTKGQGSVSRGIQWVQAQRISVTKRSLNVIKSYRNYMFRVDKDGKILNDPDDTVHEWSNSMDAVRYGLESFKPQETDDTPPDDSYLFAQGNY
jgi:phage terminase large subunit